MKKNRVFIQRVAFIAIASLLVFSIWALTGSWAAQDTDQKNTTAAEQNIVVMELFTSQGCSSCPPADALLAEYASAHDMRIIPISFHVDYWNRLGWTDPFSSSAYSARQKWYSQYLPEHGVFTPQLVVNGKSETVGNNRNAVKNLVRKELQLKQVGTITIEGMSMGKNALSFRYKAFNILHEGLLNIALIQKQATTNIKAGENEGVTITNHNIVRSFSTQPLSGDGEARIDLPVAFKASDYALVVFVQDKKDHSIIAASTKNF
jgi:hypothetical protein